MRLSKTDKRIIETVSDGKTFMFSRDLSCNIRKINSAVKLRDAGMIDLTYNDGWFMCHPVGTRVNLSTGIVEGK